jgi:predicted transcriptional regulator
VPIISNNASASRVVEIHSRVVVTIRFSRSPPSTSLTSVDDSIRMLLFPVISTKIAEDQALLLGLVGNDGIARQDVLDAMAISATQKQAIKMIDDLLAKRLLGWDNETLVFLTQRCATIFTPRGGLIAHDLEDQRLAEWMAKPERWSTTAT